MKKTTKQAIIILIVILVFIILIKRIGIMPAEKSAIKEDIAENTSPEDVIEEDMAEKIALPKDIPVKLDSYAVERQRMVDIQLRARGITDKAVLAAMAAVPRHEFVPFSLKDLAYEDHPLPIGFGQTISQPYIVALMTEELGLEKDNKVLEIGTGSGYQAAVLNELGADTYSIEIIEELAKRANNTLKGLGCGVKVKHGDGYFGWEDFAPFDAIIVTAAADHIPPPLLEQLKDNGKLIIPLGSTLAFQTLTIITKRGDNLDTEFITGVRFVPMTGEVREK